MRKHKCSFDWDKNNIHLTLGNHKLVIKAATESPTAALEPEITTIPPEGAASPKKNVGAKFNIFPRQSGTKHSYTHKRWLPKKLLQAQGYHQGNTKIWVPKRKNTSFATADTLVQFNQPAPQKQTKWVPKISKPQGTTS